MDPEPDWSMGPAICLAGQSRVIIETAEFVDSSYMTRATYNLRANDLIITLRNGEILRVAPISVEYWDRLLAAPSKGRFFLNTLSRVITSRDSMPAGSEGCTFDSNHDYRLCSDCGTASPKCSKTEGLEWWREMNSNCRYRF